METKAPQYQLSKMSLEAVSQTSYALFSRSQNFQTWNPSPN